MQSVHEGLSSPSSSTSPTMRIIFILKSSNPMYAVPFINTFYHFINSNVAKFFNQMPLPMLTQYGDLDQCLYWDTICRWLPTKAEEQLTYPWKWDFTLAGMKLLFQEVSWVMK